MACEERLANKRTNKSSYSCSCSNSYIRSYICSDKTLSILYCSPFIIPTATLSPPINYSQDSASTPFFCHFSSLIACGDCCSFVCVIPVSFPSGVLAGKGGRGLESNPNVQQGSKNVLKLASLLSKSGLRNKRLNHKPNSNGGGMLKSYWNFWKRLSSEGNRHSQPASNPKKASYLAFLIPIAS